MAQRRQCIRRLARLTDEQRQTARLQHRVAITELARYIDVYRNARELLKPVFRDQTGVKLVPQATIVTRFTVPRSNSISGSDT